MGKYILGCLGVAVIGIIILVIMGFSMGASTYNNLVTLKQGVDAQWAEVQNQYQRRFDLIPNLVQTVSGAANFEKSTLTEVTEARASVGQVKLDPSQAPTDPAKLQQFEQAQGSLGNALSRLLVVAERYPDLKANQSFLDLQAQLEGTENRITTARYGFNQAAQSYNTAVQVFPSNLFAGMFGFTQRPYFQSKEGSDVPPPVHFDFTTPTNAAPAH
ncbi:LemA family protein [Methylacidiphilales bacterium]|nr:LemA family protein [Candidatus Methylacidiphilales bacterium]MDB4793691.1 LemA family protein [Candidatus Methylacidiphilales bacterium]